MGAAGGSGEPRGARSAQGKQGVAALQRCRLASRALARAGGREGARSRQRVRAQARVVPSGGATVSSTPCQARGPTGCQPWTSGPALALGRLAWVWGEPHQEHQEPATGPAAPFLLWDRTGWWTMLGWRALRHQGVAGAGCQERPDLREPCATARAQEAVGADFTATPGQHHAGGSGG